MLLDGTTRDAISRVKTLIGCSSILVMQVLGTWALIITREDLKRSNYEVNKEIENIKNSKSQIHPEKQD